LRARTTYSATKRDEGSVAALGAVFADIPRFLAYRATHLRGLFAAVPLQRRFIQPGVLFVGYIEAGLGLGESLRGLIRSIATTGVPYALYPFNLGVESRFVGRFAERLYDTRRRYRVNVVEMSADQVPAMFRELGLWKTAHSYNILRTYWELPTAPAEWSFMLEGIHEIWAPNQFVANAFRQIFPGPIRILPPCVEIDTDSALDRDCFEMKQDVFYFVFSFDYFSHPARKNPLAVARAFQRAFPDRNERVGLVIKSTGAPDHAPGT
jgi:glycosyltransferase involved in cell wall biosynthesis